MNILKYAAVAAMAIGPCATHCLKRPPPEKITPEEWMKTYVSQITGDKKDEQKKLIASYLFWRIREDEAEDFMPHGDANALLQAKLAAIASLAAAEKAYDAADLTAKIAIDLVKMDKWSRYESFYVALYSALWNSDKVGDKTFGDRILNNQNVLMAPTEKNIKFKAPVLVPEKCTPATWKLDLYP